MDYEGIESYENESSGEEPDWGSIVDDILEMIDGREKFSFIDEDCDTWEVVAKGDGYLAMCLQKNALLRIQPS